MNNTYYKEIGKISKDADNLIELIPGVEIQDGAKLYVISNKPKTKPWIIHDGGKRPVALDAIIRVKFRSGRTDVPIFLDSLDWQWSPQSTRNSDVIEYRIIG